jgi:predicted PurR-regulated permease PerM
VPLTSRPEGPPQDAPKGSPAGARAPLAADDPAAGDPAGATAYSAVPVGSPLLDAAGPGAGARPDEAAAAPPSGDQLALPVDGVAVPAAPARGGAVDPLPASRRPALRVDAFRIGFVGALGVFAAVALVQAVVAAGQVVTLVFAALFLATGLNPLVSWLERQGLSRGPAVALTFLMLVAVATAFLAAIIPVVIEQATGFAGDIPRYIRRFESLPDIQRLDERYGLFERVNTELEQRLTSGETVEAVFGGVLGAGRAVATGVFSVLTVLILTLYFLVSLRPMTRAASRLVPASRRVRVERIAAEAQRRVGGYVSGQLAIASLNGALSFVVMMILDVRYAVALAFAVAVLGLIPLVGATLGAVLVALVTALSSFGSAPPDAGWWTILGDTIILVVWFVVYQQVENYVIAPRIFARSVAVPGTVAVVAALIGGSLLGLLGALVAVPMAAVILLVIQEVVVPMQDER